MHAPTGKYLSDSVARPIKFEYPNNFLVACLFTIMVRAGGGGWVGERAKNHHAARSGRSPDPARCVRWGSRRGREPTEAQPRRREPTEAQARRGSGTGAAAGATTAAA